MSAAAETIRKARHEARLTQAQLAARMGTTQTAVARLERHGANPTVSTLRRALAAAEHRLTLGAEPAPSSVDEEQIRRNLQLTPAQRLAAFEAGYRNTARLMRDIHR